MLYDYGRLRLLAPDLRPRSKLLKDLEKDPRAVAIVRIWQHLADDACPVLRDLPTLERTAAGVVPRAARAVRSTWTPPPWLTDEGEVRAVLEVVDTRIAALDRAIEWWSQANAHGGPERGGVNPLRDRVGADFDLLGVQLAKVRFAWGEVRAALKDVKPLDLSFRRVRIVPVPLQSGLVPPRTPVKLGDEQRDALYARLVTEQERLARRLPGTPWALLLEKGWILTFRKDVQVIDPEPERPGPRPPPESQPGRGEGDKPPAKPPKPTPPPPPPPPGPRPGSGGSGPVTGG
jgi:hypothetical protein